MRKLTSVLVVVSLVAVLLAVAPVAHAAPAAGDVTGSLALESPAGWLDGLRSVLGWLLPWSPAPDPETGPRSVTGASQSGPAAGGDAGSGDVFTPGDQAGEMIDPDG